MGVGGSETGVGGFGPGVAAECLEIASVARVSGNLALKYENV